MSNEPTTRPFSYVFIPSDAKAQVTSVRFEGTSDEAFRDTMRRFFAKATYTEGQRCEARDALLAKVQDKSKISDSVLDNIVGDEGAFEIVPIVMPNRTNRFVAVSLYIDDKGRFKDLPLNDRASRVAQRDIRGDAFLCSNHDDPALDSWERVDTSLETYEALYTNPKPPVDKDNQAQMMAEARSRDSDTILVSPEAASEALELRAQGNDEFAKGNFQVAAGMYATASEKLRGRVDLLPDEQELEKARIACLLNLSQCCLNLQNWTAAANAAAQALTFQPSNPKGWFRLTRAQVQLKDFDEAEKSLLRCAAHGVPQVDIDALSVTIAEGRRVLAESERQRYKNMFA